MTKIVKTITTPSLGLNAKSYCWGEELEAIAKYADEIAVKHNLSVTMNIPFTDIYRIRQVAPHIIINAQGVDGIEPGGRMGGALPEALKAAGADGVVINHAARPMRMTEVITAVKRAKACGLNTHVCADSIEECQMVAMLHPTSIIVEQAALIGTSTTSPVEYMDETTKAIHDIDPNIMVSHGAGIRTAEDILRNIEHGSCGGGGASGVFCAPDKFAAIDEFLRGVLMAREKFGSKTYTFEYEVED